MKKVLLIGLLVVCGCASFSQTGVLDQTFGVGGKVTIGSNCNSSTFTDAVLQPDGKIVAAGGTCFPIGWGYAVMRFNSNGSFDSTFGIVKFEKQ